VRTVDHQSHTNTAGPLHAHRVQGKGNSSSPRQAADAGNLTLQHLLSRGQIRPKFKIGAPDDPLESEAEQMAENVIDEAGPCGCAGGSHHCESCRRDARVRRAPKTGVSDRTTAGEGSSPLSIGTGRPLSHGERALAGRIGSGFDAVQIYTGPAAESASAEISARAFAIGQDIAFGAGEYNPNTRAGQILLAHELTHTVQNRLVSEEGNLVRRQPTSPTGVAGGGNQPADFDPCAVDVPKLTNSALLEHFQKAENYVNGLLAAKRKGEERFYDYQNLLRRLKQERAKRVAAGQRWLSANIHQVPSTLYLLKPSLFGNIIGVTEADTVAAGSNEPVAGGIIVTVDQFYTLLEREGIPTVDAEEFFRTREKANEPGQLNLRLPPRPQAPMASYTVGDPFGLQGPAERLTDSPPLFGAHGADTAGFASPFGLQGSAGRLAGSPPAFGPRSGSMAGVVSPLTAHVWGPFGKPVVTAGPFGFSPQQVEGFRTDWRGDTGEARFAAQDPESLAALRDLNKAKANFPLYDPYDPRTELFISIKTQLPGAPGGEGSLTTTQTAWRELFGQADPRKRANALSLLQTHIDPALTQDEMLLRTRIAVNRENVTKAQDQLEKSIRNMRGSYYEPLVSAMLRQQPEAVTLADGSTRAYADFNSLLTDLNAKRISGAEYKRVLGQLGQRARTQIISNASSESTLRSLLEYRQKYDFTRAKEFQGVPDTAPGRQQARTLQEKYFRRIGVPELMEAQAGGGRAPIIEGAAGSGALMGAGTATVFGLPGMVENWESDPYAGRRYLTTVALSGFGGGAQSAADEAFRMQVSQWGLDWAAGRAAAGETVAPLAIATPLARLGGSTAIGGVASAGITLGGMWMGERFFGEDYSTIDYTAKGTRAFVSGAAGALASAGAAAVLGAEGAGGLCTFIEPGGGTVVCGVIGGGVGFIVGLVGYTVFDYAFGEDVESGVRVAMGEEGCTGAKGAPTVERPVESASPMLACFACGTFVRMGSGSIKQIERLQVGDRVVSFDFSLGKIVSAIVEKLATHVNERCRRIMMRNGVTLRVTDHHPIYAANGGPLRLVEAACVRPGDALYWLDSNGRLETVRIARVEIEDEAQTVYDVMVDGHHNFFVEELLVHNKAF
jgi:hypothetical protein